MITPLLYVVLSLLPAVLLLGALEFHSRLQRASNLRLPVTDKLLRSPGEGAFKKIKELDHRALEIATAFVAVPATIMVFYLSFKLSAFRPLPGSTGIIIVAVSAVFAGIAAHLFDILKQRDNWRLGFSGERFVGEELNKLMLEGCHVFHDFPLNSNWNLDHIVVAPSGVFAIETKTRGKGKTRRGQKQLSHEIIYDGKGLQFPNFYDTEQLTQAQDQADHLAQFLAETLQESVYVNPILTFPGWYVILKGAGDVAVLNPKQIHLKVVNSTAVLSPDQVKRIARQLEQKCRDVAF